MTVDEALDQLHAMAINEYPEDIMAVAIIRREIARQHYTLVACHSLVCTKDNCRLDGGPEHDMAFNPTKHKDAEQDDNDN